MSDNWHALEQHVRDRIADAQAVARSQALAGESSTPHRHSYSIGLIQRASSVLAKVLAWVMERSHLFTEPPAATKRY
jgi:hypothetical protein